ncbi:uncharacterized protein LOC134190039 [Corticium candelabrum]|uniref:uncharacterized protein LOC134190039 n=1 Tax=Corticium candelabrum TaxID=121492 RepID=UPI002E25BF87|nr:uncharacterized protein LOC134190039 [Corticium candelabrum]
MMTPIKKMEATLTALFHVNEPPKGSSLMHSSDYEDRQRQQIMSWKDPDPTARLSMLRLVVFPVCHGRFVISLGLIEKAISTNSSGCGMESGTWQVLNGVG